ncbi:hypothetical protein PoB_004749900 [Plakobranchus ocellatus]|uniref:Uncharacterized protein n=1 Tax=Plakobranchus ocellatus TaxID=259542 RepID=A0AAV4BQ93_9GAST|nr:hypothetical protein PoB_004749900 [Plakobranchus ocellatus]
MVLSALTVCCKEISCLKTFVDRQTVQTERPNDRRYALVHGFLLTAPVVMDIPQISFAPPSPPSNQAVAGRNWRHEAAPDFRATLKPPAEYKIRSKENDRCIKMLS